MSQCSSQTESEPEGAVLGWDAVDFQEMSAEIGRIGRVSSPGQDGIVELSDALAMLKSIDICAAADDECLHETIRQISDTILLHLNRLIDQSDDYNSEETRLVLLALLAPNVLSLLFAFRALFRAIAASSTISTSTSVISATWLHNLEMQSTEASIAHSVEYWDVEHVIALEVEPRAALSMMLRLLFCALCTVRDANPEQLSESVLDVLLKICWSTRYLLHIVEIDNASLTALIGIICNMFVLLSDGTLELGIKDLIVEIMSMSSTGMQGAVAVVSDPRSEFMMSLDRSELCCLDDGKSRGTIPFANLRIVKQTIQLLMLMWTSGTSPRSIPQSAQKFLSALAAWLGDVDTDSPAWSVLGDAFVGIVAILEQRRADPIFTAIDRCWDELLVWRLAREADPSELPLASSFALYIATTAHLRHSDYLLWAEAWDYLRDVLLLILTSDHEGPDEPLALLIAPSVCTALIALLVNASGTGFHYSLSSPWTLCMVSYLKNLQNCEHPHRDYAQILYERIGEQAKLVCQGVRPVNGVYLSCNTAHSSFDLLRSLRVASPILQAARARSVH
ncbi:hypothetical protein C8T65DRAFT_563205 [Cerioporus squamosus]|nr:hypothetical protein C8T65DRAFT_563205 [Cerioporus squamosus]